MVDGPQRRTHYGMSFVNRFAFSLKLRPGVELAHMIGFPTAVISRAEAIVRAIAQAEKQGEYCVFTASWLRACSPQ